MPQAGTGDSALRAVAALTADDVWVVGNAGGDLQPDATPLVLHWDGDSVERVANPNPGTNRNDLYAVAATGPDDVWAVGQQASGVSDPLTLHFGGTDWVEVGAPGRYQLTVSLSGCTPVSQRVDVTAGQTKSINITPDC